MAALTDQVAQETWELMFRMLGISAGLVSDTIAAGGETVELSKKALEALIDKIRKSRAEANGPVLNEDGTVALQELIKKIDADKTGLLSLPVADEDVSLIKHHFKKQGLTFATMDVGFDDMQLFLFASSESRKAELAVMQAQAERGLLSDLNPNMFFDNMESKNIGTISGLNNVELELFRYHAKRNGLLFTSVAENGANTVVYDLDTVGKAKKTMSDVLWDITGEKGELVRTQVEHKISNRQAVNLAFLDGEREYYIVNGNQPENYIHITANDFEYYKKSKKVFDVSRSQVGFMDRAIQAVNGIDNPMLLSKDAFERSSDEELQTHISSFMKQSYDADLLQKAIDEQMDRRINIEEKMSLDDENQGAFWLFDDSISFSEGAGNEAINDLDDAQREMLIKLKESSKHLTINEYQADDKNLDTLIAKAEAQRDRGYRYADEPEQII